MPPLAMLDLSKPAERQAHDFLRRATTGRDRMWEVSSIRRHGDTLLCIVGWTARYGKSGKSFSLADVKLTEAAVSWRDYPSRQAVWEAMERRCLANNGEFAT